MTKTVRLVPLHDDLYALTELTNDEVADLDRKRQNAERFEQLHGLAFEALSTLVKRQSELCAQCSQTITPATAYYEAGGVGEAAYCEQCSMTVHVRKDQERFNPYYRQEQADAR